MMEIDREETASPEVQAKLDQQNDDDSVDADDDVDAVGKEEDVSGDGGVTKKIIAAGSGWEKPSKGSDVTVHYTGRLEDGSEFDSSVSRGQPFSFKLGQGQVIKGWDLGVARMKKGEKALLTIKSEYGYGASGSGAKIPPNATLLFEVELLSWTSEKDLTKDGGVVKKILHEGEGWETPNDCCKVSFHVVCRLLGESGHAAAELLNTRSGAGTPLECVAGEEQLNAGLEKAIGSMKKGEKALVRIAPSYLYGESGSADTCILLATSDHLRGDASHKPSQPVPANATLQYEIELVEMVRERDSYTMDNVEKVITAERKKEEGNSFFKAGRYEMACKRYKRALDFVQYGSFEKFREYEPDSDNDDDDDNDNDNDNDHGHDHNDDKGATGGANVGDNASDGDHAKKRKKSVERSEEEKARMAQVPGLKERANTLKTTLPLNMAAVALKHHDYKEVKKQAKKSLETDAANVKAFYRMAEAEIGLGEFAEAMTWIEKGLAKDADSTDFKRLHARVKKLQAEQDKKDKQLYSKMFR